MGHYPRINRLTKAEVRSELQEYPKVKVGDPVFYEAFGLGELPAKVIEIKGKTGLPSTQQRVKVKLTIRKPRNGYLPGDEIETFGFRVFPKETLSSTDLRDYAYMLLAD